jgi:O-acetyl-ADP-ribose deacetylase (regulator of RNase III)
MKLIERDLLRAFSLSGEVLICHQVNCLGIMGGGLALVIKKRLPHVFDAYAAKTDWRLGDCQFVKVVGNQWVANLAGQQNISRSVQQTDYNALCQAFRQARDFARANGLLLCVPHMMGCGLGGGDWSVVSAMLEDIAPETIICKLP